MIWYIILALMIGVGAAIGIMRWRMYRRWKLYKQGRPHGY
jgi:hypothetical protein